MRSQNIVLFSSGVSEREGISLAIRDALEAMGYSCSYWRELFRDAKDSRNISLLPMLVKKIPTFDFAVLICEGHDRTMVQRGEHGETVPTMRDNVLFEIGLCVMALGLPRVILVTDGQVRLPEDLMGPNNSLAVKQVCYCAADAASVQQAAANTARYIAGVPDACGQIQAYIEQNKACYSPVVVGAAANTACGYASNFVVRLLNGLDGTVTLEGLDRWNGERAALHVVLPQSLRQQTVPAADGLRKGRMAGAAYRPLEFFYRMEGETLAIYDFPTSLATSYKTARMILQMEADDTGDQRAEQRFLAKELDLFEGTLRALLCEAFVQQTLSQQMPEKDEGWLKQRSAELARRMEQMVTVERA